MPESPPSSSPGPRREGFGAFAVPGFGRFWAGSVSSILGQQMVSVAMGWELYEITGSATVLGFVGLAHAIPIVGLALWSGSLADRYNRRKIVLVAQSLMFFCAITLAMVSSRLLPIPENSLIRFANQFITGTARFLGEGEIKSDDPRLPVYFLLLFGFGVSRVLNNPSRAAIVPRLVPGELLTNAITWNSSAMHIAATFGPALGAFLVSLVDPSPWEFAIVYAADAGCALVMFLAFLSLPHEVGEPIRKTGSTDEPPRRGWLDGARHVFRDQILIGSISLDMFAVLFGGCTALLPIFAKDILKTDVVGYSWLRAAPSIGAFCMGVLLAYRPPRRSVGSVLFISVVLFGLATLGFALSTNYAISLVMLALIGAFDNISVVIRNSLVQIRTPDDLRGRVSAVNGVFIGTSNELGALESGLTAAMWGPVGSVVVGGVATILVVVTISRLCPELRRLESLEARH
jgi:MFS family permease